MLNLLMPSASPKLLVENVDIYERLTRIENPEDIKEIVGIVC